MDIDKDFKRKVRIQSRNEYDTSIHDTETGEMITNVTKLVITVDAHVANTVEVTYEVYGKGDPVSETTTLKDPEIDIVA
jgi:hypothetical protein